MREPQGFDVAHERTLPTRIEAIWGELAAGQASDLTSLAFRLPDGRAWSYEPASGGISLARGSDAATVVELEETDWQGLFGSSETVMGLLMNQRAAVVSGSPQNLVAWETALRVLYEMLPPWDPEAPLVGGDGVELDPGMSFQPDDDPERMADFLRTAGYIVVREVLPANEVDGLVEAAEIARDRAVEGDGESWWSTHADGRQILARVLTAGADERMRALPGDPRLTKIVGLSDFELEPTETEGVSVLFKQSGMIADGKADQPWHRDCGLGGHNLMCPLMNGSLFLKPAGRESGELRFLPGSWRTAGYRVDDPDYQLGIGIEAAPGDFSLHYGDGLHAGTPPTSDAGPFRWSAVFEYGPVGRTAEQSQEHYDQVMQHADTRSLVQR